MQNLTGVEGCDEQIKKELREAGIHLVFHEQKPRGEVATSVTGELGDLTFHRAWYYWVVNGPVRLDLAQQMYANESRRDVRVAGHCAAPLPDDWAEPSVENLEWQISKGGCDGKPFDPDGSIVKIIRAARNVNSYHIDSQEGLNFFVESYCKYRGIPSALSQIAVTP